MLFLVHRPSKEDSTAAVEATAASAAAAGPSDSVVSDVSAPTADKPAADETLHKDDVSDSNKPAEPTQLTQPENLPESILKHTQPTEQPTVVEETPVPITTEIKDVPLDEIALKEKQAETEQANSSETKVNNDKTDSQVTNEEPHGMKRSEAISDITKALQEADNSEPKVEQQDTETDKTQSHRTGEKEVHFEEPQGSEQVQGSDVVDGLSKIEVNLEDVQEETVLQSEPPATTNDESSNVPKQPKEEEHDDLLKNFHKVLHSEISKLTGLNKSEQETGDLPDGTQKPGSEITNDSKGVPASTGEKKENTSASSKPVSPFQHNTTRTDTQPLTKNINSTNNANPIQNSQDGPMKMKAKNLPSFLAAGGQLPSGFVKGTPGTEAVQMVGSHEDTQEDLAQSQQEYKKQFSDRKKYFKQQMEEQGGPPIKVAPPPASYRQEAPKAALDNTQVVLSPVVTPAQLRFPTSSVPPPAPR